MIKNVIGIKDVFIRSGRGYSLTRQNVIFLVWYLCCSRLNPTTLLLSRSGSLPLTPPYRYRLFPRSNFLPWDWIGHDNLGQLHLTEESYPNRNTIIKYNIDKRVVLTQYVSSDLLRLTKRRRSDLPRRPRVRYNNTRSSVGSRGPSVVFYLSPVLVSVTSTIPCNLEASVYVRRWRKMNYYY